MPARIPLADRFWSKVKKTDGCWLWTGGTDSAGYGMMVLTNKSIGLRKAIKATRVSWQLHVGGIPEGICVCHSCDVPACVNPAHLWLGTHTENMRDMMAKGRRKGVSLPGEKNPMSKLTWESVGVIRQRHSAGASGVSLAKDFGVTPQLICLVVNGKAWIAP